LDYAFVTTDENGSASIRYYNHDGRLSHKAVVLRDAHGNITRSGRESPGHPVTWLWIYEYEYDAYGNWTKKMLMRGPPREGEVMSQPAEATYKTIEYHEKEE
jgi:hypothetical protein